jgi:trehalose 6-phosphate phosphatase
MPKPPVPDPSASALFLDIDGTLVEHHEHPEAVKVSPSLLTILRDLNVKLDGALAFVTGRDLAMVDRLFGTLGLAAAGTFGIECALGDELVSGQEEAALVSDTFAELEAACSHMQGVYFEYKGPVLAVHTRANPGALDAVTEVCRNALSALPQGYRLVEGHAGVELLPERATKGAAIAWFMDRDPFRDRVPVFLGDDTSDESGFDWVNARGGMSIRIRPEGPTLARYTIASVAEVHDWLHMLLHKADSGTPAN